MASYFGEVLETYSRAYGVDCDDDTDLSDVLKSEYELSWVSGDRPNAADLFFVVDGKCCRAFSALLRQKSELIATIVRTHQREGGENPNLRHRKELPSCIYKLKSGVYLCEVSPDVQVIQANAFTSKLHEFFITSKEVIVLTSLTSNRYTSWKTNSAPFLKGLASCNYTNNGKVLLVPQLETPNIVTGVAASALMFCEIKKIPGCLYICYTPKEDIDIAIFTSLKQLFSQVPDLKSTVDDLKYESKEIDCFTYRAGNLYL